MKYLLPLIIICFLFSASPVFAIPTSPIQQNLFGEILGFGQIAARESLGDRAISEIDVRLVALRFVRAALSFVGIIFVVMILYAGFMYMTSGGNSERTGKAKKIIFQSTIGVAIILTSYSITIAASRAILYSIRQEIFSQGQSCQTNNGPSTCCREMARYNDAHTTNPGTDIVRDRYEELQECWERTSL